MVKGGRWPKYSTLGNPGLVNNKNMCVCTWNHFSCVWLFEALWTVALQAPVFMGFSRQECWSVLPSPPPGDFPSPGVKLVSPAAPALAGEFFTTAPLESTVPVISSASPWHLTLSDHDLGACLRTSCPFLRILHFYYLYNIPLPPKINITYNS